MEKNSRIYIAGHRGLVGSAITRALLEAGFSNLALKTHAELELRNQQAVEDFFWREQPEYVFLAAAKVGGIYANSIYPAEFIYDNIIMETNIIQAAHKYKAKKLLFMGSSCIYPKLAPQPLKEEYLLTGALEPTNEAYAIAKIAGIKLCQAYRRQYGDNFIAAMPTNLYGINDNFDLNTAHVLPALLRKFYAAQIANSPTVTIWGTGTPRREFLYVDDLAAACLFLMQQYDGEPIVNVGTGQDLTIAELAQLIAAVVGFTGQIEYDLAKPDGTPIKLLDVSKMSDMGWQAKTSLRIGVEKTFEWYLKNNVI